MAGKRKTAFWVGTGAVLVAGILILMSSFLPRISGPFGFGSVNGMDLVTEDQFGLDNRFFE